MLPRVGLFGLAQLAGLAAGLVVQGVVAHRLGAADYGRFVMAQSVLLAGLVLLLSAVPNALRRRVSIDSGSLHGAWRVWWLVQVPLAAGCAAALLCLSAPVAAAFNDRALGPALAVVGFELVIRGGVLEPAWYLLNGLARHAMQAALMVVYSGLRVVCVAAILQWSAGLVEAVTGLVAAAGIGALLTLGAVVAVKKVTPPAVQAESARELWQWVQLAPAAEVLTYLAVTANLWIAKALLPDAESAGTYAACYALAHAALPFGIVLSRSFFSPFARAVTRGEHEEAKRLLRQPLRLIALAGGLGLAVAVLYGEGILGMIYGERFAMPGTLLGVVGLGMTGMAAVWFLADMLAAAGRLEAKLWAGGCSFLISLSAALALTGPLGVWGAAWALLAAGALGSAVVAFALRRVVSGFVPWPTLARAALAAGLVVLIGHVGGHRFEISYALPGIGAAVAGYCLFLAAMGEPFARAGGLLARRVSGGSSVTSTSLGAESHE
jgi:O-antigen/teichoic acid export membrane protein